MSGQKAKISGQTKPEESRKSEFVAWTMKYVIPWWYTVKPQTRREMSNMDEDIEISEYSARTITYLLRALVIKQALGDNFRFTMDTSVLNGLIDDLEARQECR